MESFILVNLVVFGVVSWTTTFLLTRRLLPKRSFDFCNRLVSIIHASSAVTLSVLSVPDWSYPVCPLASDSSPAQTKALAVSLAYFIYDLFCGLFDKKIKVDNAVHHLVSIVGFAAGLAYKKCGAELVAALCITEISTPFLHSRELLKEMGHKDSNLNLAADISFALIFTAARMVAGPYLTYATISADNPLLIKAMAFGLQLDSGFWSYKIARMVKYKLRERTKST